MTVEKSLLLLIDDSPEDIHFLMDYLQGEYKVLAATSGEKCLQIAKLDPKPDLILLDVMMPGIDGYETCRRIKDDPQTQDIEVIFISALDTTEEIMKGYDAGGSDFIVKPVSPDELNKKIQWTLKTIEEKRKIIKEKADLNVAFMAALSTSSDLGNVLKFLRNSFAAKSMEDLGDLIVRSLLEDGALHSSVQIRNSTERMNFSPSGLISPLEDKLLLSAKNHGRIFEHESRLIVNDKDISILVKNFPFSNPDYSGRIRDNLAVLIEGAQSRLNAIKKEIKLNAQNQSIMSNVLHTLREHVTTIGLTKNEENKIIAAVEEGINKTFNSTATSE